MKLFMTILTMIFVSGAAQFVYAADEFGERFDDGAPAALREPAPEEEIKMSAASLMFHLPRRLAARSFLTAVTRARCR